MNRLIALLALTSALTVAACDDPNSSNAPETADPGLDAVTAPAAGDVAAPAAAPSATDAPPLDTTALPPEKRSSEESVKPESETLFY